MRITKEAYNKIMSTVGCYRPETGGALFSDDGGYTVMSFVYDRRSGRTGASYSPNTEFINEIITQNRKIGYTFVGFVHSHPGDNKMSRGFGGYGYGHTASDEEAFCRLMASMKGTRKLYFPILRSSFNCGRAEMRVYVAEKDRSERVIIYEERIEVVDDSDDAMCERSLSDGMRCGCAVLFAGSAGVRECAVRLARKGVRKFVFVDGGRYTAEDIRRDAFERDISRYKTDCFSESVLSVNPSALCRSIRYDLNEIDDESFERLVKTLGCKEMVIYIATADEKVRERVLQLQKAYYCSTVEIEVNDKMVRTYTTAVKGQKKILRREESLPQCCADEPHTIAALAAEETILSALDGDEAHSSEEEKPCHADKWAALYSREEIEKKTVVVIGCGGSRSYVENLARAGIRKFVLCDGDAYSLGNLQTQMCYIDEIGKNKAVLAAEAVRRINPNADVKVYAAMLDETVDDDAFAALVGKDLTESPDDVLIAACTDNVIAQARCVRLALKYHCPVLTTGIYPGGRILEIVFCHPAVSSVCPRCILHKRYEANLHAEHKPAPAVSDGTSVFFTEELNAKKGFISLALLLYGTDADARYSKFLEDNKWPCKHRHFGRRMPKKRYDRNLMFYTMDYRMAENTGIKKYRKFDKWGRRLGDKYQVGVSYFIKQKPRTGCPDCGGKGNLADIEIQDTRDGLY